ncbi:hypothetical protein [Marinobacter adhaerens]|uniref:hypothetical protein n=1 Tax=Marinobacter adhaerens TaxID=1033846 RepID=UPI003D10D803
MGQYNFGVGAPPISVYFSGDWDVRWGYGLFTHGHLSEGKNVLSIVFGLWLALLLEGKQGWRRSWPPERGLVDEVRNPWDDQGPPKRDRTFPHDGKVTHGQLGKATLGHLGKVAHGHLGARNIDEQNQGTSTIGAVLF